MHGFRERVIYWSSSIVCPLYTAGGGLLGTDDGNTVVANYWDKEQSLVRVASWIHVHMLYAPPRSIHILSANTVIPMACRWRVACIVAAQHKYAIAYKKWVEFI